MGDAEYIAVFTNLLLPVAFSFAPELIIISAGFDSADGDPLGGCRLSPEGYACMTKLLMSVCPRIVLALEGGYNLKSISQ